MFKGNLLASKKGSVLPVTLIVIAVLTLAITLTTKLTLTTAENTQREITKVQSRNTGEGLINESMNLMEKFINENRSFPDGVFIDSVYLNTGLDAGYGNTYAVEVDDVSDESVGDGYGDFGELRIHKYRFSYEMESGKKLVRYLHATTGSASVDTYDPFSYNIGTNGDLVLGGGYYKDASFFADNIYISKIASWQNQVTSKLDRTPAGNASFPYFEGTSVMTTNGLVRVCPDWTCFNRNNDINKTVRVKTENYTELITTLDTYPSQDDVNIVDYFGDWSFEDFVLEYITDVAVSSNNSKITDPVDFDNIGAVIEANASNRPWFSFMMSGSYTDLTNDRNYMFDQNPLYSIYYGNDLLIDESLRIRFPGEDHEETALFVDGDLTIDMGGVANQRLSGNIIVNGDLLITGNTFDIQGTLIVLGETTIDFDAGQGFTTDENNWFTSHGNFLLNLIYTIIYDDELIHDGYTILSLDNIYINEYYSQNTGPLVDESFGVFMYTEESIYIDGVVSNFHVDGSMYARAAGNSGNDLNIVTWPDNEPFRGIFISSYQGYVNAAGKEIPDGGIANVLSNGFVSSINTVRDYQERFSVVPTWESLVFFTEGYASFFPDEFTIED